MFEYTKAELADMADSYRFQRDTLEKVIRLTKALEYFNINPLTKDTLALKGGTAINLGLFNLQRLSVDIDLDYTRSDSRGEMLEVREQITRDINKFMTTQGYHYSEKSKTTHALDSFVFTYENSGGNSDNLKIEINYLLRAHLFEPTHRQLSVGIPDKSVLMNCLQPMEIFAAKINALLNRAAVRDLYDTWNMIRFGLFDESEEQLLRKSVIFYTALSAKDILENYPLDRINAFPLKRIKAELIPVLNKDEHVDFEVMKSEVTGYLKELLAPTKTEKEFLIAFKQKIYKPELLFDDGQILSKIRHHPMIEWKIR